MAESSTNVRWTMDALSIPVDALSGGMNELVASQKLAKIRVYDFALMADDAVIARFRSGDSGRILTGLLPIGSWPWMAGWSTDGHFETDAGDALNLEVTVSQGVRGWVKYRVIAPSLGHTSL